MAEGRGFEPRSALADSSGKTVRQGLSPGSKGKDNAANAGGTTALRTPRLRVRVPSWLPWPRSSMDRAGMTFHHPLSPQTSARNRFLRKNRGGKFEFSAARTKGTTPGECPWEYIARKRSPKGLSRTFCPPDRHDTANATGTTWLNSGSTERVQFPSVPAPRRQTRHPFGAGRVTGLFLHLLSP